HQHYRLSIALEQLLQLCQGFADCSRSVGVREDNAAVVRRVICEVDGEVFAQRNFAGRYAKQLAIKFVEAVGDVRKQQGLGLLKKRHKGQSQHLVGTIADKDLLRLHRIIFSEGLLQSVRVGVRVEAQTRDGIGIQHLLYPG